MGILINNVGLLMCDLELTPFEEVEACVTTNIFSQLIMTKAILPIFKKRVFKSAIIDLSSIAALAVREKMNLYCSTKVWNNYFSVSERLISESNEDGIDWLCVRPAMVSTNMVNNRYIDIITTSVDALVNRCLRMLGNERLVYGSRKHEFWGWVYETGYSVFNPIAVRYFVMDVVTFGFNKVMGIKNNAHINDIIKK